MEIKYIFANGEETTIEVYGDFEGIILELDRNLYNNNQTETRRHVSLTDFNQDGEMFNDIGLDVENRVFDKFDKNFLREIISKLKPDEQDLINKLCLDDEPMTQKQYANTLGITENAVRKRLKKVRTKLKNLV